MDKIKKFIPLVVLLALVAGGFYIDRSRQARASSLSGIFESTPSMLSSRVGGRVVEILAPEGSAVKKGQPILRLEAQSTADQANATSAQAQSAEAKAAELRNGSRHEEIARQEAAVAELKAQVNKLQNGALPEDLAIAEQNVRVASAKLSMVRQGARREDRMAAEANMKQAEAVYRASLRGATQEERAQAESRYQSARTQAEQARRDAERQRKLFEQGAVARRQAEQAETAARTAELGAEEARQARDRIARGTPREEKEASREAFRRAQAQYLALRNGSRPQEVREAEAQYSIAQENLRLVRRGARQEDRAAAGARLKQAEALLTQLKNGARREEIEAANASAKAARLLADSANKDLDETLVIAPMDGVVDRVLVAVGDLIQKGVATVRFTDPRDIWVRVYVPESWLARVKVNGSVRMRIDGIEGEVEGRVESIATQGEFTPANLQTPEERGKQVFATKVRLAQPDPRVKAGMAVTVLGFGE